MNKQTADDEFKNAFQINMNLDGVYGTIAGNREYRVTPSSRFWFTLNRTFTAIICIGSFGLGLASLMTWSSGGKPFALLLGGFCIICTFVTAYELWNSPKAWKEFLKRTSEKIRKTTRFHIYQDGLQLGADKWSWSTIEKITVRTDAPRSLTVHPRVGETIVVDAGRTPITPLTRLKELMESRRTAYGTEQSLPEALKDLRGHGDSEKQP